MLACLVVGLLLSAVHGIRTQPSLSQRVDNIQPTSNQLVHWYGQYSSGDRQALERRHPRFWLSQLLFQPSAHMQEEPLNDYDVYRGNDHLTSLGSQRMDRTEVDDLSNERMPRIASHEPAYLEKRDSYLSMCHFKLCNLGRKRRISQEGPSDLAPDLLNSDK